MTAEPIKLLLTHDVPIILQHVLTRKLEAQRFAGSSGCHYAGPCAIGCIIPEERRASFDSRLYDNDTAFTTLADFQIFLTESPLEYEEYKLLQELHDALSIARHALHTVRFLYEADADPVMRQRGIDFQIQSCKEKRRAFFTNLRQLSDRYAS